MKRSPKSSRKRGEQPILKVLPPAKVIGGFNPIWGDDAPILLKEAAFHAGMPLPTFKQKVYAREIDSVKVGRWRKVQPSAVRAYFQKHKRPAL